MDNTSQLKVEQEFYPKYETNDIGVKLSLRQ